jgi:hypothetical protein
MSDQAAITKLNIAADTAYTAGADVASSDLLPSQTGPIAGDRTTVFRIDYATSTAAQLSLSIDGFQNLKVGPPTVAGVLSQQFVQVVPGELVNFVFDVTCTIRRFVVSEVVRELF